MAAIDLLKEKCCGCMLCEELCPSNAIVTKYSEKGFYTPTIDRNKCMGCEVCSEYCPIINAAFIKKQDIAQMVYLAKNRNLKGKTNATSGGIFFALASHIILGGGAVYGVTYTKAWKAKHMRANSLSDCRRFQGFHYLQSEMGNVYEQISEDILMGETVLFTGTPCQVAAVGQYIKYQNIDAGNLILAEILCDGVSSPRLFQKHIAYLEKIKQMRVTSYRFRDERNSWNNHYILSVTFENGDELSENQLLQSFSSLCSNKLNVNESCFFCPYTDLHRCADITMGESWGIENYAPAFSDNPGISQVHINTPKGKEVWTEILTAFELMEVSAEKILPYNSIFCKPVPKPSEYVQFWKYYQKKGYERTLKKYAVVEKRQMLYHMMIKIVKNLFTLLKNKLL